MDAIQDVRKPQADLVAAQTYSQRGIALAGLGRLAEAEANFRRVVALAGPLKTDGPLAERLGALVRQRARVLEAMTPTRRSALLLAPSSPTIADRLADGHRLSRTHVARVFAPELGRVRGTARAELLAALSAAASWSTWEELRAHQGLTPARAERTLARMLRALLGKDD